MEPGRSGRSKNFWERCKAFLRKIHFNTDKIFYRIGVSIATRPWLWLIISFCISAVCGPGFLFWAEEVDDVELFMPLDSIVRADAAWVKEHFRDDLRYESIIVTAPNVLDSEVLQALYEIEESVKSIVVDNDTWNDVCAGYLTWFEDEEGTVDLGETEFTAEIMANLNTSIKHDCLYQSLLKVWRPEERTNFQNANRDSILADVTAALSDQNNNNMLLDISLLLSGVEYDARGYVVGAKATILNFLLKKSHPRSPDWELEFIKKVLYSNRTLPDGMAIYAVATRSFTDFLHQVLNSNMTVLFCGLSLIVIYIILMIGRCNIVQQRIYLSIVGVSVIGQAILSAYGICYYMGYFYGPIHPILPFLLLGIGVDDMFVIMQSLENISKVEKPSDLTERIARALQQSGMSITVTSVTNIVAFAIGVTTVMPFLESFCMFATMGILFLYIFEITFFVSCLVYDERRLQLQRDGCCCRPTPEWKPTGCSQKNIQQTIFEKFLGPFVTKTPVKIAILALTTFILGSNVWGICQLEQNFDPTWYLNQDSYPILYNNKLKEYFPKYGKRAGIYLGDVDYYRDHQALVNFTEALKANPYVNNQTVDCWFIAFDKWLQARSLDPEDNDEYHSYLTEYLLLTKEGQAYIKDIKFNRIPINDYNITTSQIQIQHVLINTTSDQIRAMELIRETVESINFSMGNEHVAVFSPDYVSWTANKIIGEELIRNLGLEILAVGLVTIILLQDLEASFWVICCVLFTLVDLLGSMYYLGLTIEISSSIMVLLCAGLAVDYAAHIGMEFTRMKGTKNERAVATLSVMGPAVFNGGLSTFLAFVLLGASEAYLFSTFFKLFTCVVVFGLFHGLLFLPVILSLFGPNELKIEKDAEIVTTPQQISMNNKSQSIDVEQQD
ncbi:patched domain-containing protein 3-like isoform X1 [Neodiprion fabricii]|uniref:patched domain-containing protein 3-like isoform X1 n=2 Tax=Neodiprion fabricii TaxID=2872261 RepID=UPI001ED94CAA|nr:patched domain-containing protein 3-like isoform X1 [Neodiprion fabricii]